MSNKYFVINIVSFVLLQGEGKQRQGVFKKIIRHNLKKRPCSAANYAKRSVRKNKLASTIYCTI